MARDLSDLQFRFEFRKYQRLALSALGGDEDRRHHVVAPPGSGKTILGLELIRRAGKPAVVFSPTATIADQWIDKVGLFLPESDAGAVEKIAGSDPDSLRAINSFTYQLIAAPGDDGALFSDAARESWANELVGSGRELDPARAKERIGRLEAANPASFRAEIRRHVAAVKRGYMADPDFDATKLIHPNARELIDRIVAHGVGTVVLDESHHLLDYWALVLRTLLTRLSDPLVIALTATPPLGADDEQTANYNAIAGEIDFEVPTPAVVKEGNLSPYQDLVYFCRPTDRERRYIDTVEERFERAVAEVGARPDFRAWATAVLAAPSNAKGEPIEWADAFERDPALCIAAGRFIRAELGVPIPETATPLPEMEDELDPEDWAHLIAGFGLRHLKLSGDPADHEAYEGLKLLFAEFGYALTEAGLRRRRAPADRILAYSDQKNAATIEILRAEMGALGDDLRACVITDFEKESAAARALEGVLDPDAGGAARAFRAIVANETTHELDPILVTGSNVLVDADAAQRVAVAMREWVRSEGLRIAIDLEETGEERITRIAGAGGDWRSGSYVRMITHLFGAGVTRCLVGTRGLLGEGWDSLELNTLVDLTSITTSVGVNQVRGRSIRIDPAQPAKVADNWDVVCVEPSFAGGSRDIERLLGKHAKFFGVSEKGRVARGAIGLDPDLARFVMTHSTNPLARFDAGRLNQRMLRRARERARAYERWGVGREYQNIELRATKLDARDLKFRTAHTMRDTIKAMVKAILLTMTTLMTIGVGLAAGVTSDPIVLAAAATLVAVLFVLTSRSIRNLYRMAFVDLPLDSFLLDIGKALLTAMRESGLVAGDLSVDNVRVSEDEVGFYDVWIDYAEPADADAFAKALDELLAPVTDQRYLVSRDEADLDIGFYGKVFELITKLHRGLGRNRRAWHPVPTELARNKERAERFAEHWRHYVGGGELLYTRTPEGRSTMLALRVENAHRIKRTGYAMWV